MKKALVILTVALMLVQCGKKGVRQEISLNGTWDFAMTSPDASLPGKFPSKTVVPGLVDMANPAVENQDTAYENKLYWYRRKFSVTDRDAEIIRLKINKSRYHTRVWVNGSFAGENIYSFTPSYFDVGQFIKAGENELIISVGCKNNLPDTVTNGWDFEKIKYIPGIYDDVRLTTGYYPFIRNIQVAPDPENSKIRISAEIEGNGRPSVGYKVVEVVSGKTVAEGSIKAEKVPGGMMADAVVNIDSCRLWSPDDPFMYELVLETGSDSKAAKFGMRSFRAAEEGGVFLLNGNPYYMTGTNVCIYRFFEDPERNGLPWDNKWVTMLHQRFREMGWTSIRYCIGFPPERWYEIADSLGFLIQDEYPLWTLGKDNFKKYLGNLNSKQLAAEYREWMRERWNHPCVVVWDAQNESITDTTGKAISLVRDLDLSGRPWDNGWAAPVSPTDAIESHPYLFSRYQRQKPAREGYLKELMGIDRIPGNDPNDHSRLPDRKRYENPVILNEYGWIWLNRNGTTTTLTDKVYENVFPEIKTTEERLETYAKNLGMLTEYWRSGRHAAAVMHFCGLGYSRPEEPRGQTSDHFINLKELTLEPNFVKYVKPAFSPVGIMIAFWEKSVKPGSVSDVPVYLINDTYDDFRGTVTIALKQKGRITYTDTLVDTIPSMGKSTVNFRAQMPAGAGTCRMEASLVFRGDTIRSIREFSVR